MVDNVGRIAGWSACAAVVAYGIVQLLQVLGVTTQPIDAILIYLASLAIAPPFLLAVLALHHRAVDAARYWTRAAAAFAIMYANYALTVYVVQLAAVLPYLGGSSAEAVLAMRPHSLFWTLDALAYCCMGAATLFIGLAARHMPGGRKLAVAGFANAAMTPIIATVYFAPHFSTGLLMLGSPWLLTASGTMALLASRFGRPDQARHLVTRSKATSSE